MGAKHKTDEFDEHLIQFLTEGYSLQDAAELLHTHVSTIHEHIRILVAAGRLVRTHKGHYALPVNGDASTPAVSPAAPAAPEVLHPVENRSKVVQIPAYMLGRPPVTLYITRGEEELDAVLRLELCMDGRWFELATYGDLRLYLGENRPRWSPTQISYEDVTAYRVTLENGRQCEYAHDSRFPLTIDRKLE